MTVYLFDNTKTVIGTVDPLYYKQRMQLNGLISHTLTAKYDPKLEAVHYFGSRDVDNENVFWMYRITNALKQGDTIELTGIYLLFDELQGDVVRDIRPTNALASAALNNILSGSQWQLGVNLTTKRASGNYYYVSKLSAFFDFLNTWGVEFQPRLTWSNGQITGRYIDLYDKLSDDYGKWFEYGDKLLTITAEQANDQIYTALIGMGKGEEVGDGYGRKIKFDDIEWSVANGDPVDKPIGQDYVELPDATAQYGFRVNIVDFPDITDKTELLQATYNQLVYQSRPRITFKATALETGLVELGETVTIIRDDLGIRYKTRVFEIERDFLDKTAKTFTLGDKVVSSAAERIIKTERERQGLEQEVSSRLEDIRDEIVKSYFDNDGYNYDLRVGNEYGLPAGYYSFNRPIDMDPSEVVYMGGGRILIANSKLPDGEWDWRTALDGDGMLADIIHAGKLMGTNAEWNLEDGTFLLGESVDNYGLSWDGQTLKVNTKIETSLIQIGDRTLEDVLYEIGQEINQLASGGGNLLLNSNFGTGAEPSDTFWSDRLEYRSIRQRELKYEAIRSGAVDYILIRAGDV